MKWNWKGCCFWAVLLTLWIPGIGMVLCQRAKASVLKEYIWESQEFRRQELSEELYVQLKRETKGNREFAKALTITMLDGGFHPETLSVDGEAYLRYKKEEFLKLWRYYEAIWTEALCFPVPGNGVSYENTYGAVRTYGGERVHEGIDLFEKHNKPGYAPILSMCDGSVEEVGWLPLGGYRIGIRSPGGVYFYYAHLSSYEREFQKGERVEAGEILGYMGDTGYGPEGTYGKFPVHLHLGMYIATERISELSVNPYWILRALEKKSRKYTYS